MFGPARTNRAFTLLELLVAMVLMVVTASCLYTALYTGFRAHRSALSAVEPTARAINAIELLKQDIRGILPPDDAVLAGAFLGVDSAGIKGVDVDSLEFYTTGVYEIEDQPVGGLAKIELVLEEDTEVDDGTYRLLRRVTTNLLPPRDVDPEEHVLCREVVSLNLRYFDGSGWYDEWDSTADANNLPVAVEIDIEVVDQSGNSTTSQTTDLKTRRLLQSFPIPCGAVATEESETEI